MMNLFKPPRGYPEATPRLTGSQPVGTLRPPLGYPEATPRLPRGSPEATPRLPRGYPEATPRLHPLPLRRLFGRKGVKPKIGIRTVRTQQAAPGWGTRGGTKGL